LTTACDSVKILPEVCALFVAVAAGRDGAIGSRFSHESVMINYPFFKTLCNRAFHLLVKLLLVRRVHDISTNLNLYRADIFKDLVIEERHFAANAELGLKPLLAGYDIQEVPISWINRTVELGSASFVIGRVGEHYAGTLLRATLSSRRAGGRARGTKGGVGSRRGP